MKNSFRDINIQSKNDKDEISLINEILENTNESGFNILDNFTKYAQLSTISRFLTRYEVYKLQLGLPGVILDIGVGRGSSLFTWAKLSEIFEPVNYTREIHGFDTFIGMNKIDRKDKNKKKTTNFGIFKPKENSYENIKKSIKLFNINRKLSHIDKVFLYKGDVEKTILKFEKESPHALVSLLHLDVDIYKPTKFVLKRIIKRMPKGAIILFGELSTKLYPGETRALLETLDIKKKSIKRFPFSTTMSYLII